jgi:hypothetical protein
LRRALAALFCGQSGPRHLISFSSASKIPIAAAAIAPILIRQPLLEQRKISLLLKGEMRTLAQLRCRTERRSLPRLAFERYENVG